MSARMIEHIRTDCREAVHGSEGTLSALKGDKVLITGGTGFMGSWLAELLTCLNDDFSFGVKVFLLARNVEKFKALYPHLAERRDLTLIRSDVRDAFEVPVDPQWVIHAAASPDNRLHSSNPVETMSVIGGGTMTIVRALDRCSNLKKFLNVSSGLVYGSQPWDVERLSETFPGAPANGSVSSAYAEAKRFAETYCGAARSQQRLPLVTVRPFAFVGPYQSLETPWAINNFFRDALTGPAIRVQGDGQTVRSYMYGSDLAVWLLRILTGGDTGAVYNVGSPEGVKLERLAQMIAEQFNPRREIRMNASNSKVAPRTIFVPDVAHAAGLGLTLRTPLSRAIERTIQWNRACAGFPLIAA